MQRVVIAIALLPLAGCWTRPATTVGDASSPSPTASNDPVPSATPSPTPSINPIPSATLSPPGTRIAARVVAPATVMPIASLCVAAVFETADGNFEPLFCGDGSINVAAWERYAPFAPNVLAAGLHPSLKVLDTAFGKDFARHVTNVEEMDAYRLAAAYYGWSFWPNPACEYIYKVAVCH